MTRQRNLAEHYHPERASLALSILRDYEVTLVSAVFWQEDASWVVERRQINNIMLLIPVTGGFIATVDDQDYSVPTGSLLIVHEGVPHAMRTAPGIEVLHQVSIHCYITSTWRPPLLPLFESPVQPLAHPAAWKDRLCQLVTATNHDSFGQHYGNMLIRDLLNERILAGAALCPANPDIDPRIAHALKKIHRNYAQDLTVADLAKQARLSTVQFRKLFDRHIHQSPKQYILNHRLKVATQLLRSTSDTVQSIAFDTGFNSEAYFHRCFRSMHDCTPSDYRAGRAQGV